MDQQKNGESNRNQMRKRTTSHNSADDCEHPSSSCKRAKKGTINLILQDDHSFSANHETQGTSHAETLGNEYQAGLQPNHPEAGSDNLILQDDHPFSPNHKAQGTAETETLGDEYQADLQFNHPETESDNLILQDDHPFSPNHEAQGTSQAKTLGNEYQEDLQYNHPEAESDNLILQDDHPLSPNHEAQGTSHAETLGDQNQADLQSNHQETENDNLILQDDHSFPPNHEAQRTSHAETLGDEYQAGLPPNHPEAASDRMILQGYRSFLPNHEAQELIESSSINGQRRRKKSSKKTKKKREREAMSMENFQENFGIRSSAGFDFNRDSQSFVHCLHSPRTHQIDWGLPFFRPENGDQHWDDFDNFYRREPLELIESSSINDQRRRKKSSKKTKKSRREREREATSMGSFHENFGIRSSAGFDFNRDSQSFVHCLHSPRTQQIDWGFPFFRPENSNQHFDDFDNFYLREHLENGQQHFNSSPNSHRIERRPLALQLLDAHVQDELRVQASNLLSSIVSTLRDNIQEELRLQNDRLFSSIERLQPLNNEQQCLNPAMIQNLCSPYNLCQEHFDEQVARPIEQRPISHCPTCSCRTG